MGLFRRLEYLKDTGLGKGFTHEVVVPAGPGSRPGERIWAPSDSLHGPMPLASDESREDFRVIVSRQLSTFGATCLGPTSRRGEPVNRAKYRIVRHLARSPSFSASDVTPEVIAGEHGCRYRIQFDKTRLIEWQFGHNGWQFAAGVICHPRDDERRMEDRARVILSSWEWIEPTEEMIEADDERILRDGERPDRLWSNDH